MMNETEKTFEQTELMSKEEAIKEIKSFFKGNRKFIDQATILIYSTHKFIKINKMEKNFDNWNWEKYLHLSIDTEIGFKHLYYRKGNKKYGYTIEKEEKGQRYNNTSEIDEYGLAVYNSEDKNVEEYRLN